MWRSSTRSPYRRMPTSLVLQPLGPKASMCVATPFDHCAAYCLDCRMGAPCRAGSGSRLHCVWSDGTGPISFALFAQLLTHLKTKVVHAVLKLGYPPPPRPRPPLSPFTLSPCRPPTPSPPSRLSGLLRSIADAARRGRRICAHRYNVLLLDADISILSHPFAPGKAATCAAVLESTQYQCHTRCK